MSTYVIGLLLITAAVIGLIALISAFGLPPAGGYLLGGFHAWTLVWMHSREEQP